MGKGNAQKASIEERFILGEELGEGGNARVFVAKEIETGEEVALKRLEHFDEEKESRFRNEIHIMKEVAADIPGVMPILECSDNHLWYTMPIVTPIMRQIVNKGEWKAGKIVAFFLSLTETLEQLHDKQICHRDIKPANIYYWRNRLYFGDFGLVDFPDADTLTHSDRALGSTFTIAPEMKRNPKDSDGKPADVYSMAKTLWMLLTRDDQGFDGQYNGNDRQHQLNKYDHLKEDHFLEIEDLLSWSTSTKPEDRPTIRQFKDCLEKWLHIIKDPDLCQELDWVHLNQRLFDGKVPESVTYKKRDSIVDILNKISVSPVFNHMLTSPYGGLDLDGAELSTEDDRLCILANGYRLVVKPEALYFESFKDPKWNYFLLEASPLEPVLDDTSTVWDESVVEDRPGHYVDGTDACYGVYSYDESVPFPNGWRRVMRILKGKFLFVMKRGYYNMIPATYDGRHSYCSAKDFRDLIDLYQNHLCEERDKGYDDDYILNSAFYSVNPYEKVEIASDNAPRLPSPKEFIDQNYKKWCFAIPDIKSEESVLVYFFSFNKDMEICWPFYNRKVSLISVEGKVVERDEGNLEEILVVTSREKALEVASSFNAQIAVFCEGFDASVVPAHIDIKWQRVKNPSHLFTKEEMLKLYKEADDRKGNKLVIDEDGYARMLPAETKGALYPVAHETFGGRNNYVGKYSPLSTFETDYLDLLQGWLYHLQTGRYVYCDGSDYSRKDETTLRKEILKYY